MYTHVHTCTHMYTHVHTCTHMYTHVHTCTHMYTHVHTCTHMYTHVHTCTHMYTHVHTCAHMYTHVHICTHMCTHVHVCSCLHVHDASRVERSERYQSSHAANTCDCLESMRVFRNRCVLWNTPNAFLKRLLGQTVETFSNSSQKRCPRSEYRVL